MRESDYGWIVFAFQAAYAAMMPLAGRFIDAMGVRLGYLIAVRAVEFRRHGSCAGGKRDGIRRGQIRAGHWRIGQFSGGAEKAVTNWFPPRERALATGNFQQRSEHRIDRRTFSRALAGILYRLAERSFVITGAAGFLWMVVWWTFYKEPWDHPGLSESERALIKPEGRDMRARPRTSWPVLLTKRMAWALVSDR